MPPVDSRPLRCAGKVQNLVHIFDERDRLAAPVRLARQALGAGQDDEQIRVRQDGDLRGETVVVAEAQFLDGDDCRFR